MGFFFLLILFSFIMGVLSSFLPFQKKLGLGYLADFGRGLLVALVALYLVGTPMALVVAGIGLLAANLWFPYPRWRERKIYGSAAGMLLVMAPDLFLLLLGWAFIYILLQRRLEEAVFISFSLALPFLMLLSSKSDVYVLFSVLIFLVVFLGNLERLEEGLRWMSSRAGMRRFKEQRENFFSPSRRKFLLRVGYSALILLLATGFFLNRYVYRGFGIQVDLFRQGTNQARVVALTFDDGPDPNFTPHILDILQEEEVKATFFMVGRHAEQHPLIARRVVDEGHEIGNHTYSHYNLLQAPRQRVINEIELAEDAIFNASGQRPSLFRPPRGLYDAQAMEELVKRGYTTVLWSLSSRDWLELRSADIVRNVLHNVAHGDIILFHDSGNLVRAYGGDRLPTVQALQPIIEGLKEEGYDFVTITELLILSGLSGDI